MELIIYVMIAWFLPSIMKMLGYKPDYSNLYCGISMYIGVKPANIDKIKILGLYNVSRGSDACGIVINNVVSKGVDDFKPNPSIKQANFSNFIEKKNLVVNENDENYNIIVHNRKASTSWSEKSNPDHAHPFEITDPDNNVVLIGAHNGSISNCEELKKAYDMTETYPVDSQLMLSILAKNRKEKHPYKVLEEYKGKAVLTWFYLDEPNVLYVYKGASKEYSTSAVEEERPMFVWEDEPLKSLYFSSIREALYAIGGNETNTFNLETNKVYKFIAGKKAKITLVNREIVQSQNFSQGSGQRNNSQCVDTRSSGVSASRYTTASSYNRGGSSVPIRSLSLTTIEKTFRNYPNYKKILKAAKKFGGVQLNEKKFCMIEYEPFTFDPSKKKSKVYFHKGRYFQNGHMIGGNKPKEVVSLELDYLGYEKYGKIKVDESSLETYYFYMGFIMRDKTCADALQKRLKTSPEEIILKEDNYKTSFFLQEIVKYTYGFVSNFNDDRGATKEWDYQNNSAVYATGVFYPLFDYDRGYVFSNGNFLGSDYDNTSITQNAANTIKNNGRTTALTKHEKVKNTQLFATFADNASTPIILPEKLTKEVNEVEKEEFLDAALDFVKDGENIGTQFTEKMSDTELENIMIAINKTVRHVKRRLTNATSKNETNNDNTPKRGLLFS